MDEDVYYKDDMILFSSDDDGNDKDEDKDNNDGKISTFKEYVDNDDIPWVEKYRPVKLDDIIEHKEDITILKNSIEINIYLYFNQIDVF